MTLLGAGFQMGTTAPSEVDMSLDEMIKGRAKRATKPVSNADRSIATGRANRTARHNARRGLRSSDKASAMEIETAVQKQAQRTKLAASKKIVQKSKKNATALTSKQKAVVRKAKQEVAKAAIPKKKQQKQQQLQPAMTQPTQKAVKAARNALANAGYKIPPHHTVVVVANNPEPAVKKNAAAANKKNGTKKQHQQPPPQQQDTKKTRRRAKK